VPGTSSFLRAAATHPAGTSRSRLHERVVIVFQDHDPLDIRYPPFSGLTCRGSHARAPTHRPHRYLCRRKARYRCGRLLLHRTGFAPAGRLLRISWLPHVASPFGPALPGRTVDVDETHRTGTAQDITDTLRGHCCQVISKGRAYQETGREAVLLARNRSQPRSIWAVVSVGASSPRSRLPNQTR
jgi:hypothetical protein